MVGSIGQISQRLAALEQQIESLGEQFYETYRGYLTSLGQTVKQQVILSCYHVCTENYPKRFLDLSVSQRQAFQDELRELAAQSQTRLIELLQPIEATIAEPELPDLPDELEALLTGEGFDTEPEEPIGSQPPLTPLEALSEWQDQLERSIVKTLKSTSNEANRLLQESEILPKRVPPPVLEAAAKAEGADAVAGTPNLLNLLIEASEKAQDPDKPNSSGNALMHIVAINLRLSEIEFNDPTLMTWRNKLRELKNEFQSIGREYQKKRREQAIAEAQLAWKSTWTNDA